MEILKYFVEESKISDELNFALLGAAAKYGRLDCLQYLVEEAKAPLNNLEGIANARYFEQRECVNYLLEKGCPEPTDEEYAWFVEQIEEMERLRLYTERNTWRETSSDAAREKILVQKCTHITVEFYFDAFLHKTTHHKTVTRRRRRRRRR